MTPAEIVALLREVAADAKAVAGDYYGDQFAWQGAGEVADAVEQLAAEVERLREYVRTDARCPCCDTTERCAGDCTFAADCPVQWQRMVAARETLGVEVEE